MRKFILILIFCSLFSCKNGLYSQTPPVSFIKFTPNRLATVITSTGIFNQDMVYNNFPGMEWPVGSGKYAFFTTGLSIAGKVNGSLRMAAASYSGEYTLGYGINGYAYHNDDIRIYSIKENDSELNNPDYADYYKMIPYGAPYDDVNSNGTFDRGIDIPGVKSAAQTVFMVITDGFPETHNSSEGFGGGTQPLDAEIRLTFWGYNALGLEDVHFIRYQIINKSTSFWDSTFFSFFCDPDLGEATDDRVGCDSVLGLGYVYNSSNNDGTGTGITYGLNPPAAGISFLSINKQGYTNHSATSFLTPLKASYGGPSCEGEPDNPREAYNFMKGFKNDGTQYINTVTMNPTKFNFTGDPETNTGWTESNGYVINCNGELTGDI